ncbi:MAG: hypothetical protein ACI9MC_002785 [Kiritimatiellia bacterium]|jgi:hypothetical protein
MTRSIGRMLALTVALASCVSLSASCSAYRPISDPNPVQEQERVILLNFGNMVYVRVVRLGMDRTPAGLLEAKVQLLNKSLSTRKVDVKVEFRDKDGFELESTNWQPHLLGSEVVQTIRTNSMNNQAADFKIYIRNME